MANNRLYLYDPEDGQTFLIAKGGGDGWVIWEDETLAKRLQEWLDLRDLETAYANKLSTSLQLLTEYDLPDEKKNRE